jgi:aminodeoxyfutalosine synthase
VEDFLSSVEILKTYAISRLLLDNIPHIKAYWATSTINLALVALDFGADDLDGTIQKESIQSSAGAKSSSGMKFEEFLDLIQTSGFVPVQRDSLYNKIEVYNH